MPEFFRNSVDTPSKERAAITAVLAFCASMSACSESDVGGEAIMPFIHDGSVSTCPVNLECAQGKTFETGLKDCIDFSRCDPPMEK